MRPGPLITAALCTLLIAGVTDSARAHRPARDRAVSLKNASIARSGPVAAPHSRTHQAAVLGPGTTRQRSREIHISGHHAVKQFTLAEPAGTIKLFRLTLPEGMRVKLTASIPHLAGIAMSAPQSSLPSQPCRQRGPTDVCTQSEEACPMPAATWHLRLQELAGSPGEIRVQLVVG